MNQKILFNDGWEFAKSGLGVTSPEGLAFQPVDLPHDWLIYNTLNLYENSIGWYRKRFVAPKAHHVLLYFEGVYMDSTVYVNGQPVGEWKYGYSSFEHEITGALREGENEVLVKVVHQSPNSRWYSGAGIYRNVWLKIRGENYIETHGVYISTCKEEEGKNRWVVEVDTDLCLRQEGELVHRLLDGGQVLAASESVVTEKDDRPNRQQLFVEDPGLWSPENPRLYELITELYIVTEDEAGNRKKQKVETLTHRIGFKEAVFDPDKGLFLNGKKIKLQGTCEHHDLGALGAAFNKTAMRRRFRLLKEMGVNAVRTAHNMPAPEFMDLADEMGLLVVAEAFDMWELPKTPYDYSRFFKEWAGKDVKSWVTRDRNHPSLLMWSIGNEIYDTHADAKRGQELTKMLAAYVRKYDPKGNAKITIGSNYMPWENAQKCAEHVEVVGYNYGDKYYQEHHAKYPHWVIYGSETGSVVQSRGVYHFPYEVPMLSDDDEQCSALGNSTVSWGAKSPEACIITERDTPFSLGQFIWSGFDYIGEPTPYHTKNAYFGQLDTATFKKDSYYIYQAGWTDYKTNPMVHIFPYWDFNPGQMIDVRVCSNAPRIELQLNGVTVGTFDIDHRHGDQLVGWWKIPYQEGELNAIAYDENGRVIATAVRRSFRDPARIRLTPDKRWLYADGTDLIFVEITMEDEDGNLVENAGNRVHVAVTGAGRLLGLDNGDSTDYDQYKGTSRRLFNGKLMAIIGATLEPGKIRIEVSSKGLPGVVEEYEALPATGKDLTGVSAQMRNKEVPCVLGHEDEIPLRKIELICDGERVLTKEKPEVLVRAKLHPENASYQELEWEVVNERGIPAPLAKVEARGLEAKVTALADGAFRLRCKSRNGSGKVRLISQLEFTAKGLGTMYKNPYEFISAGLYDYSKGEVGNGNEKGVATADDGETQIGFRNLDFGPVGSDTITIPIFTLSNEPYSLEIWEGMPGEEGSSMLAELIYQKESRYNVYQSETYKLPKRLRGLTSLCFVTRRKMHIKGFSFAKPERAFMRIDAGDADRIYGDSYQVRGKAVEGIGNNVTLEFAGMGFGPEGAGRLVVYGRTPLAKNTIHLLFSGAVGESRQIIEFPRTEEYKEQAFTLERITGEQKVSFVFLPGSNFDFGWFRFEPYDAGDKRRV